MTSQQPDVLVIGAGVSGLTTAICLAEAGCGVTVAAAQRAPLITSAAAGAIWGPHLVGIDERVTRWGAVTLARLADLTTDHASGVHLASGITASADQRAELFDWVSVLSSASPCGPADLPDGYAAGWRLTAPIVSMPVYLRYLMARLDRAGGQLREAEFGSLAEAAGLTTAPVIVNCSGMGARRLVPDLDVTPVRGQIVVTENPGLSEFFIGVRLEAEVLDGGVVLVHNYGHGGAGVTLSWGCALEVTATVLG